MTFVMAEPLRKVLNSPLLAGVIGVFSALGTRYIDGRVSMALLEQRVNQIEQRNEAQDKVDSVLLASANTLALAAERLAVRVDVIEKRLEHHETNQ